jgi:hypothetical protein
MGVDRWIVCGVVAFQGFCLSAQDVTCTTSLTTREIRGNLNVPARCQLTGTEVRGNVTLFSGGSLIARDVRILGNLEGSRADFVNIDDSFIDGNLRLQEFVGM